MITVSIIEKKLILLQKEHYSDQRIKVGLGSTRLFKKLTEQTGFVNSNTDVLFMIESLSEYLFLLFSDTNNFKNSKENINRNFLMHGMWESDIQKTDCLKLFLALFNLILVIDVFMDTSDFINKKS